MNSESSDESGRAEAAEEPPEGSGHACPSRSPSPLLPTLDRITPHAGNETESIPRSPVATTTVAAPRTSPNQTSANRNGAVKPTRTKGRASVNGNGLSLAPPTLGNSHANGNGYANGNGLTINGHAPTNDHAPAVNGNGHKPASRVKNRLTGANGEPSLLNGGEAASPASRIRSSNPRTRAFRKRFFPEASDREWNDWRWQSRHRIRTLERFEQMVTLSDAERDALLRGGTMLPVGITPYYMSLLDPDNPLQPLRKTVVPTTSEFVRTVGEADDPLGEDSHSPVPGLVHRYPDRVLLLPLDFCSTYCRYCTRSRVVGHGEIVPNEARLEAIFQYLEKTPQVRDVLVSGGDALALSDDKLDYILGRLRRIRHIEFVRIGTKMPAVLPQRITPELCRVLRKYHPLWMSVHFLHPDECTPESAKACARLSDAGIPLGSQTVLLQGVNDDVETMKQLVHRLLLMRVRPYYLYQCDPISGSSHFRTPVAKGLEIIEGLRGHTTGYAVPTYVIDAPGGGGKIPLQPDYVVGREGDFLLLRNFEGKTYRYPDPTSTPSHGLPEATPELVGAGTDGGR